MPRHMRLVVDIGADQAADLDEEIKHAPFAATRSAVAREALVADFEGADTDPAKPREPGPRRGNGSPRRVCAEGFDDPHVEVAQRAHDRDLRAVYIARGLILPAPDAS